ncbi:MAG TPA: M56 family metallopeptidase [Steroidobacteraceae bacterium]|nr:M56 family metallopeptidase [Steroidobacteraceae bacterium]
MNATSSFMQTLAWSLLHFLWQGAAIAAVAASLMFALRKPATRYLVGLGALALMLVSFGVTFSLIGESAASAVEFPAVGAPAAASASTLEAPALPMDELTMEGQAATFQNADFLWVSRAWLVGVFVFALRIAFGLLVIEHLRRRNLISLSPALVARFEALQHRLEIRRAIRYCECRLLRVPAVIGFFRPIVLLPVRAITGLSPEQLEAVIAHELGHIKRFDVAVNFFQVIAETLFFFHPAVWWLNRRIRADREDCCDDVAIAACGGTIGYARALATMESWRDAPSFAMAVTGSPVAARVARLLGVGSHHAGTRTAGMVTASLVLATALVAGAVSIGVVEPAMAQSSPEPVVSPVDTPKPVAEPRAPAPMPAKPAAAAKPAVAARPQRAQRPAPAAAAAPAAPAPRRAPDAPPAPSFIDAMNSVGLDNLDVDQLIALKIQGVSPDYVREIRAAGFSPDAGELIAMKIHGIDSAYVKELRATGYDLDAQELVAMKIHDVTPAYVKGMRDAGFNPDAQEIIAMKIQDVTPEYVQKIRAAGFNPDAEELLAMKIHGVTPEYQRMLAAAGYEVDTRELIHAKIMDITPEFIQKVNAHGFKNLTIEKLIQLKNADIL